MVIVILFIAIVLLAVIGCGASTSIGRHCGRCLQPLDERIDNSSLVAPRKATGRAENGASFISIGHVWDRVRRGFGTMQRRRSAQSASPAK
jgi:hypothetical protein